MTATTATTTASSDLGAMSREKEGLSMTPPGSPVKIAMSTVVFQTDCQKIL